MKKELVRKSVKPGTFAQLKGVVQKNSPAILTGLGVAGLISTTVMAVQATPKALSIIDDEVYRLYELSETTLSFSDWVMEGTIGGYSTKERINKLSKKEIVQLTWKCYIPTMIMGGFTVGCIISANNINNKRNAALASLYSLTEKSLKQYQEKVVETIGENKARAIKDDIAKDNLLANPVDESTEIIMTGNGETLCYDALGGRYFKSDIESIRKVLNQLSRDLMSEMFIPLNHVYYELGLSESIIGDQVGWHIDDGLIEPQFSSQLTENDIPCLVLNFSVEPRYVNFN